MDLRKIYETYAIEKPISSFNKKKFKSFYRKISDLKILKRDNNTLRDEFYKYDLALHKTIVINSGNERLINVYFQIYEIFKLIIYRVNTEDEDFDKFISEHINIINFILNEDRINAKNALLTHINHSCEYFLSKM